MNALLIYWRAVIEDDTYGRRRRRAPAARGWAALRRGLRGLRAALAPRWRPRRRAGVRRASARRPGPRGRAG